MDFVGGLVGYFTACDSLILGFSIYVMCNVIPANNFLSDFLGMIPGMDAGLPASMAIVYALVGNIVSANVAAMICK
jgi:hypothetical protein